MDQDWNLEHGMANGQRIKFNNWMIIDDENDDYLNCLAINRYIHNFYISECLNWLKQAWIQCYFTSRYFHSEWMNEWINGITSMNRWLKQKKLIIFYLLN